VAAIEQDAFVAVDIGDLGLAAAGRGIAGIVGEHPGLGVELADVDDRGADRSVVERKRGFLVAGDELAGFYIGAGLRVHDRALGCAVGGTAAVAAADVTDAAQVREWSAGLGSSFKCALQEEPLSAACRLQRLPRR